MSMSKRDFEKVAEVIRSNRRYAAADVSATIAVDDLARDLSVVFGSLNERFDKTRFLAACEVPERQS